MIGPVGPPPPTNQRMPPQMMQPHMPPHHPPHGPMGFGPGGPGGPWPIMNQQMPSPMMQPYMQPPGSPYNQTGYGTRVDAPVIRVQVNNDLSSKAQEEGSTKEISS